MSLKTVGDWERLKSFLGSGGKQVRNAIDKALLVEAHLLAKQMKQGITRQAPAGQKFKPLSELTIAARRYRGFKGTKALADRLDLRNSIAVVKRRGQIFVGVPRKARNRTGKSLVEVAKIHEYGAGPFIVKKTKAMSRFLHRMLRFSGIKPGGLFGSIKGIAVIRIPARPFIRPVVNKFSTQARRRFPARVKRYMKMT